MCVPILFVSHPTQICLSLISFLIQLHTFLGFVLAFFWHGWQFLACPHLARLAIFSMSSCVTPRKLFWVAKRSPNECDKGSYTLFQICATRICVRSNLLRTQLHTFSGFVLAIFDQYQYVLICYTPNFFLDWFIKPKAIRKGIMHPISNVLDTIAHMFLIHMSAMTHCFNDCFGHCFWHCLVKFCATMTKLTCQGIKYPLFEDAGRDENDGEA